MARFLDQLTNGLQKFIAEQHIFFVASAAAEGRVNLSPKGMDSFRCLDAQTVAYLDLTGSGNETAAHLLDNGRITIMLTSFGERPIILRIYGKGEAVRPGDSKWDDLIATFPRYPGERQIVLVQIDSVQTSCGFAVPRYEHIEGRNKLVEWAESEGPEGLEDYRANKNAVSIDGFPTGLTSR